MKTFYLKNKNNETISKIKAESMEDSLEYFSNIKKLDKKKLLEIYKVEDNENRDINR